MAMHYMPNSYAKHPVFTPMLRALIQTIYRALLTSAVSVKKIAAKITNPP